MKRACFGLAPVLALPLIFAPPSVAQESPESQAFMMEMIAITNDMSEETARDAAKKCLGMGEKLKGMTGLIDAQRLYFESEVERCLFYAKNNGNFSDELGDQCTHHIAYTNKLVKVIEASLKVPGTEGEYMANFAQQLESAMRMGKDLQCKADYDSFAGMAEAATAAGQKQPKEPDFAFMDEIVNTASSITQETAKADLKKCNALTAKLADKKELFPFETHFYPALIEGCLATAMEKGAPADSGGDACAHLYRRSELTVKALAEGKRAPGPFDPFLDMLREDLKGTVTQAQGLGCKQDFASLKE